MNYSLLTPINTTSALYLILTLIGSLAFLQFTGCANSATSPKSKNTPIPISEYLTNSSRDFAKMNKALSEIHTSSPSHQKNTVQSSHGSLKLHQEKKLIAPQLLLQKKDASHLLFDFKDPFIHLAATHISKLSLCGETKTGAALLATKNGTKLISLNFHGTSSWQIISENTIIDMQWMNDSICKNLYFLERHSGRLFLHRYSTQRKQNTSFLLRDKPPFWGRLSKSRHGNHLFLQLDKLPQAKWFVIDRSLKPQEIAQSQSIIDMTERNNAFFTLLLEKNNISRINRYNSLEALINNHAPQASNAIRSGHYKNITAESSGLFAQKEHQGILTYDYYKHGELIPYPYHIQVPQCSLELKHSLTIQNKNVMLHCNNFSKQKTHVVFYPSIPTVKYESDSLIDTSQQSQTTHLEAPSRDQAHTIPITMLPANNSKLTLLVVYGAYGHTITPYFDRWWTHLRSQGVTIAIAHIRGGGYHNQQWHNAGQQKNKMQSIYDTIDAANYLQERGMKLLGYGKSAGAWPLIHAAAYEPSLFHKIILEKPLVNPITQITNQDPFYRFEMNEWGDSESPEIHAMYTQTNQQLLVNARKLPEILLQFSTADLLINYRDILSWIQTLLDEQARIIIDISNTANHTGEPDLYDEIAAESRKTAYIFQ